MEGLRLLTGRKGWPQAPCSRCQATGLSWDQSGGKPICPDCQEVLALGEGPPLVERTESRPCVVCGHLGAISYLTLPLHTETPLEIDFCARHFRALLHRRLDCFALERLAEKLAALGMARRQIFLLHETFYDEEGRALQPVPGLP
jgi:hypothetical protein